MARIRFSALLLGSAALALLVSGQEQATTTTPTNQTATTNQTEAQTPPAAPQPTTPTQQAPSNATTGGTGGARPPAMSQLEVLLKGNHSWFDPSNLIHYESSDYQIVNHSDQPICNVTLSAPVATPPERTIINSSYNARVANSSHMRGIDIFVPMGGVNQIPPHGNLDLGFILAHQMSSSQENTSTITTGTPNVTFAQYCDELPPSGGATQEMAGGQTNHTTGMASGAPSNQTTAVPAGGAPSNQTQGMAGGAQQPGNATTGAAPSNATSTSGANTTTTVTPPEGGQPAARKAKGSKKLNLRHW